MSLICPTSQDITGPTLGTGHPSPRTGRGRERVAEPLLLWATPHVANGTAVMSETRETRRAVVSKSGRVEETVMRRPWVPAFAALALIWGSSFVFIKVAVGEVAPAYVALSRVALGALTLVVVLLVTRDRLPRDARLWGHLVVVATLANLIPFTLFGYAEDGRVSSVLAGIWNATTPLVTLVVTIAVFPAEKATRERVLGLLLGFAGVLTVLGVWRGVGGASLVGQLMCFGAAVCYGLMFPYVRRFVAHRSESGTSIAAAQTLIATAQLAIVAPLLAGAPADPLHLRWTVVGSLLALGALGTG